MSETETGSQASSETHAAETQQNTGPVTFETQEAFEAVLNKRLEQQKRNQFGDYAEAKEAQKRLAELEAANQTEAERTARELDEARRELAATRTTALRATVAAEKGVPVQLLSGSTQEEIEASADELIKFKGEQEPARPGSAAFGRVNTQETKGTAAERFAASLNL